MNMSYPGMLKVEGKPPIDGCNCRNCKQAREAMKPPLQEIPPNISIEFSYGSITVKVGCQRWRFAEKDEFMHWLGRYISYPKGTAAEFIETQLFCNDKLRKMTSEFFDGQDGEISTHDYNAPIAPGTDRVEIRRPHPIQLWGDSILTRPILSGCKS